MSVTRRSFLKGSALTAAAAAIGLPLLPKVADLPRPPAFVGLRYAGVEPIATGYQRLPLEALTEFEDADGAVWYDAADVTWPAVTLGADTIVLFDGQMVELGEIELSGAYWASNGDFTIEWSHEGIMATRA